MKLKPLKLGKTVYKANKDAGFFPYFSLTVRRRVNKKLATNIAVVGEAGIGKSYAAITYCLALDKHFSIDQVVFTYRDYMSLIRKLPMGRHIVFDEPSYAMGKRDWYKDLNKVLVKTIESQRFKVHPLWIPIINLTLLDKTVREHLLQYVVLLLDRGFAYVYRLHPSQWQDKMYHPYFCSLKFPLIGKCKKDSCLGCRKLKKTCREFRAQYERKKASIQDRRYKQAENEAAKLESKEFTTSQLAKLAYSMRADFTDDNGKIVVRKMRALLQRRLKLHISVGRGYDIKEWLMLEYPDEFIETV